MSKFYVPLRYDPNTANEGKWFEIYDTDDIFYGKFKLVHYDTSSKSYELALKRVRAKHLNGKKLEPHDTLKFVVSEIFLKAWELPVDPSDPKAKPVEFTTDNAIEYFGIVETMPDGDEVRPTAWILERLFEIARESKNFQSEEMFATPVEDIAKN